ncbi:PilZ domain-containing protein [Sphingomonas sp. ID1715]|uniref:PilZ domain-containing protein n=1 Tax=Sphingomonas sp. ID1715 TaxID=1656898 RepID=UPI0014879BA3|nr:PilZ domain-containing protein [Sphingomonas sp. ID1715]NNM75324.1 PilZ domain-containing protein [Sphingomonas sp. ID1715]
MAAFGLGARVQQDRREAPREEVYHRTRGMLPGGQTVPLQLVNISAGGFMARTEAEIEPETPLRIRLPLLGEREAEVRWALAGRIGCQFVRPIDLAQYLELLGALAKEVR